MIKGSRRRIEKLIRFRFRKGVEVEFERFFDGTFERHLGWVLRIGKEMYVYETFIEAERQMIRELRNGRKDSEGFYTGLYMEIDKAIWDTIEIGGGILYVCSVIQ